MMQWCAFAKPYTFSFPTSSTMFLNPESCIGKGSWILMDFWHFWTFLYYAFNASDKVSTNTNCSVFAEFYVFLHSVEPYDTQSVFRRTLASPLLEVEDIGSVDGYCTVWTTWESDAWQPFAKNYIKNNDMLNYLHVYEIYATVAVWLMTRSQNDRRCNGSRRPPSAQACWQFQANHITVEYVSYIKHIFCLPADMSC